MAKTKKGKKIFVLDTSVLLHDHTAITNFEEHDVAVPITVLEELDNFKAGHDSKNFEAREVIRFIDKFSNKDGLNEWKSLGGGKGRFKIIIDAQVKHLDAMTAFGDKKNDNRILNAALFLKENEKGRKVIMVTKDINLRIKAKALKLQRKIMRPEKSRM